MTPGPAEPTAEQMQQYLRIIVDDLLKLFEGIKIPTPSCPEGKYWITIIEFVEYLSHLYWQDGSSVSSS